MTKTTPEQVLPSPNFRTRPAEGHLAPTDLRYRWNRVPTVVLLWNRVSNLEPSVPEAETLQPGYRGPGFQALSGHPV
ncbi:hypothetical protein AVEN_178411-1 [Araneus ventricosus]|uniref:Uncharacterized protein n=1 Tax=Araneus ventricosus TaxID=182803 RepID=A0A4Y2BFV4_ARAVE|nr:hypothetical protein AVEN_178411-1 [Araneus ventricosus]